MTSKATKYICHTVLYIILTIIAVIFVFPILYMFLQGLMTFEEVSYIPKPVIPQHWQFQNFIECFTLAGNYVDDFGNVGAPYMLIYLGNSILVLVLNVLGTLLSSMLVAYGFSKINFKGKGPMFAILLGTMMIPSSITMIPMFRVYTIFGMYDTLLPLWLPVWFGGGAMNVFLLRQFMRGFPTDILESAEIDGAGHLRKLFIFVLPSCIPIIAYIAMNTTMGVWNDFFTPLLYINTQPSWPLALAVPTIVKTTDSGPVTKTHLLMAACSVMTLLPLIIFISGQKVFIENITLTGVKE